MSRNLHPTRTSVSPAQRRRALGHGGATVWFTGLSGAGKSTLAYSVEAALIDQQVAAHVLDGDNLRHGLNRDLGFTPEDRTENIRRVGEVCRLCCDAGLVTLTAFISPYRADRDRVRALHPSARFLEVYLATPLEVCEQRDPKGLYAKARAGGLAELTGVSAPYEPPADAELTIDTAEVAVADAVARVLDALRDRGVVG